MWHLLNGELYHVHNENKWFYKDDVNEDALRFRFT